MIVTGAFLADDATAVNGKLYVWGGVLTSFTRPTPTAPSEITPMLVVLTQAEDGDTTGTVPIEIHGPDGNVQRGNLPVPEITRTGTRSGFFFARVSFHVPQDGRYSIVVGSVSIPVEIDTNTD
ncbi:hypothetical protein M1M07_32205 [Rhodococcus sp. HM1]|uniref:DUF6941 family protein n=1 Tax=Rhodococcus sp. HM1 TaxID=2937759 RepID=UPI00200B4D26|nr:hypothetical protein [Rhodococcus sp. HM1]MCK8675748.1 hypothetical protein [Rhodococcus sp. HM1]